MNPYLVSEPSPISTNQALHSLPLSPAACSDERGNHHPVLTTPTGEWDWNPAGQRRVPCKRWKSPPWWCPLGPGLGRDSRQAIFVPLIATLNPSRGVFSLASRILGRLLLHRLLVPFRL